jgi:hypothetical protein
LIIDQGRRAAFAKAAQNRARAEHDLAIAARRLADVIDAVRLTRCARA